VLSKEILRIQKLRDEKEVDNYLLCSNRRLGATAGRDITKRVATECAVPESQVFLAGIEYFDDALARNPNLFAAAEIHPFESPMLVSSADLAEVILAISTAIDSDSILDGQSRPAPRVSYEVKNKANRMSPEFADQLKRNYLYISAQIGTFLADPGNSEITKRYDGAVEEFQLVILAETSSEMSFDVRFNNFVNLLLKRDVVLARNTRLTRAMLFYMYWHCDIGRIPDADSEQTFAP
jgi:hypothetical protein